MGNSKTYRGAPGWAEKNDNKGKESNYSSHPIAKPEGTHMSGDGDFMRARKGSNAGSGKSSSKRAPTSKGFGSY